MVNSRTFFQTAGNSTNNLCITPLGKIGGWPTAYDQCGINETITFHLARHTFATTITLSNGVPIESVSKMLGHRDLKTTQLYAKVVDKKISDDMSKLKELLGSKQP